MKVIFICSMICNSLKIWRMPPKFDLSPTKVVIPRVIFCPSF